MEQQVFRKITARMFLLFIIAIVGMGTVAVIVGVTRENGTWEGLTKMLTHGFAAFFLAMGFTSCIILIINLTKDHRRNMRSIQQKMNLIK